MELPTFILTFFLSKNLSLLTAFTCWTPEELSALHRASARAGVRLRALSPAPFPSARVPAHAHREGLVLDAACPGAAHFIHTASASRAFNLRHTWLVLHNDTAAGAAAQRLLADAAVLPDADVTWASRDALLDVYRVQAGRPLLVAPLPLLPNDTREALRAFWAVRPTAVARRKDLQNVYLSATTIVSQPQHFKGWSDLSNRQIDTFPKLTYPIMMLAAQDLHFRYNMRQVAVYGEERNGSFDGLAGRLQRGAAELGVASVFMRADRWRVLHYAAETVELRGAFLFRQPAQSAVSNVFLLPFSRGVWAATGGVLALGGALLTLLARHFAAADPSLQLLTPAEAFTFAVGTVCQQGFHVSPALSSARVVMFCTLTLSLFAFTAYSAKIVAILQTPSDAIRSVADLARSPMHMGVQETTYKKVYFQESSDPATQQLFRSKLLPLGERAYLSVLEGVARVRTGLFAFQVEESSAYDVISRTYTESEKCGLEQIQAFKLPMVAVPIRKHSGYRDLLAARLRWQRETGLMGRVRRTWMSERPRCGAAGAGFVSVRVLDVLPALQVLALGALLSLLLLATERAVHGAARRRRRRREHSTRSPGGALTLGYLCSYFQK